MIRAKQPQDIDAMNRFSAIPYMYARNQTYNDVMKTITFQTVVQVIVNRERTIIVDVVHNEGLENEYIEQVPEVWVYPQFLELPQRESTYKQSTFNTIFGEMTFNNFEAQKDALMIQEINTVNQNVCDPPTEKCNFFWHLTTNDMEVVTQEEIDSLLAPYKKQ